MWIVAHALGSAALDILCHFGALANIFFLDGILHCTKFIKFCLTSIFCFMVYAEEFYRVSFSFFT